MVSFANEMQRHEGLDRTQAIRQAAAVRMLPVLMTTAAMVAGLLPLLFAGGAGASSRFAIGIVVVMGMLIGTLFTLFVLPTIYSFIARDHRVETESPRQRELRTAEAEHAYGHHIPPSAAGGCLRSGPRLSTSGHARRVRGGFRHHDFRDGPYIAASRCLVASLCCYGS